MRSYRRDQGVWEDWSLEIPLTSQRISMEFGDKIVRFVRILFTDQEVFLPMKIKFR